MEWWKKNVIYHLYLSSFKDGNNDGIGDIQGLFSKLDYFKDLKVSTLLLSPFFPSPMKDNGYDITSYIDIDPKFGSMDEFDVLLQEIKRRGMNILLDFVPNHTSDQHPWFKKSVEKEDPFTDFYIWVDAKSESTEERLLLPNNWISVFGGSAWTWNDKRKQFYYHTFLSEQPDLNLRNPIVKEEMKKVLIFWLEKGVDGFRVDGASHLCEDERLLDEPVAKQRKAKKDEYGYLDHIFTKDVPDTFTLIEEWRHVLDSYSKTTKKPKIMLIEAAGEVEVVMHFYGSILQKRAEIPMNFQLYSVESTSTGKELQEIIEKWLQHMPKGKYPNWVLSSHDFPRVASRVGSKLASSLVMVMMLLPGVPICYYGDELGMLNGVIRPEEMRDSFALRTVPSNSRDPMRTPMLWNGDNNAGFTDADVPWLPVNSEYEIKNVEIQNSDPFSCLTNFKKLIKIRSEPSILFGTLDYPLVNDEVFSFLRFMVETKSYILVLNMSSETISVDLSTRNSKLPLTAVLELTNPEYYVRTISKLRNPSDQSPTDINEAHSSNTASFGFYETSELPVVVHLRDISLERHQAMVLSY